LRHGLLGRSSALERSGTCLGAAPADDGIGGADPAHGTGLVLYGEANAVGSVIAEATMGLFGMLDPGDCVL
jgi:hypothetical protein